MLQLILHWLPAKSSVWKAGSTWESVSAGSNASKTAQSLSHLVLSAGTGGLGAVVSVSSRKADLQHQAQLLGVAVLPKDPFVV